MVLLWSLIGLRRFGGIFARLMRAIALALFVLALAGPEKVMRSEGATRPAVIDTSASITPAMRAWAIDLIGNQLKLRGSDPAMLFAAENHATSISDAVAISKAPMDARSARRAQPTLKTRSARSPRIPRPRAAPR